MNRKQLSNAENATERGVELKHFILSGSKSGFCDVKVAFAGTPGYLLSDKTSENSALMRRKTSRHEIYFVARIFSLKMLFSQQRLGIVFFSVLSVFYTDTHQCSE